MDIPECKLKLCLLPLVLLVNPRPHVMHTHFCLLIIIYNNNTVVKLNKMTKKVQVISAIQCYTVYFFLISHNSSAEIEKTASAVSVVPTFTINVNCSLPSNNH